MKILLRTCQNFGNFVTYPLEIELNEDLLSLKKKIFEKLYIHPDKFFLKLNSDGVNVI